MSREYNRQQMIPPLSQMAYQIEEPEEPEEEDHSSHPFELRCCAGFPLLRYCSEELAAAQTILEVVEKVSKYFSPHLDAAYATQVEAFATFKSSSASLQLRSEGNEAYETKDYVKSLLSYDDSISHAPVNSPELSLAYANRSAILLEMGKLTDCISDVQRALDCGYPEPLKYKLLLREAKCLRDLGQSKQAKETFDLALKALELSELTVEKKGKVKSSIIEDKAMKSRKVSETYKVHDPTEVPPLSYGLNEEVPCASNALKLCYDDILGRHFVATRDIKIGDVLVVEDPYLVKPPDYDDQEIHCCTHCQKICFTLLPCPNCTWALFCSEKCLIEAGEQYHLIECPIFSKFIYLEGDTLQPVAIIVRFIAKVGLESILQYLAMPATPLNTHKANRTKGFNSEGIYNSTDFRTILNLKSSFSKQIPYQKLAYCMIALELSKCFDPINYLNSHNFTAFIYQLLDCFFLNGIPMRYICFKPEGSGVSITGIGGAIFPTMSLLNHSCNPNTLSSFYGNKIICRALYPISAGKQVTRSFGPMWDSCDKETRQQKLAYSFIFDCQCEACRNNWPHMRHLQYLPDLQIQQLNAKPDIVSKLGHLDDASLGLVLPNPNLVMTVQSLLNDKKALVTFVDRSINETSEMLDVLYNHNKIDNSDFVRYKLQMIYLYDFCGTTINNWKN